MLLAVLSDTHLDAPSEWFEGVYETYLAPADMVLHCGDMTGRSTWSYLLRHPNFHCVQGNMDDWNLAPELPPRLELVIEGLNVAATHGWGFRAGLSGRVAAAFPGRDLVFFGHAHAQEDVTYGSTRVVNPGTCRPGGGLALARIENGRVEVEFVRL